MIQRGGTQDLEDAFLWTGDLHPLISDINMNLLTRCKDGSRRGEITCVRVRVRVRA